MYMLYCLCWLLDDDEEFEESGRGNRLLGFMFENVYNTSDLDTDYQDDVIILPFLQFVSLVGNTHETTIDAMIL